MDIANLVSFSVFAFVTAITPGPNNLLLSVSGANFGLRRTLPHIYGVVSGFTFVVLIACLGLGWLLTHIPLLHQFLKVVGIIVITYLAFRIWNMGSFGDTSSDRPITFFEAFLFQWVNPNGMLVIITAISTYTNPNSGLTETFVPIIVIFFLVAWLSALIWAYSGVFIGKFLSFGKRQMWFNRISSILLITAILPVLTQL